MQEVLSKTDDSKIPLRDQEFYELLLYDSDFSGTPVFCVREAHAAWSEVDGQIMWDKKQVRAFATCQGAEEHYAARRRALAQEGFIYSDMEM